jgi:FAD/FMN-containing dehydrogenase/Fe-S oxidoreductase
MSPFRILNSSSSSFSRGRQSGHTNIDLPGLESELSSHIGGEVRFDAGSRAAYSTDSSNYRQVPIAVVVPRSIEDVVQAVRISRQFGVPILSRGAGTSLAGQCCNVAVILDWSKYLNEILEIDPARKIARVRPGCVLDNLRDATREFGFTFGPDPATHKYCTLGGMIGNNSCGIHAQMAGPVSSNVESLDILTYDGTRMTAGWMTEAEMEEAIRRGGRAGEILSRIKALRLRYENEIRERFPNIPRRISGYNLDQLIPNQEGRFNLGRALVGSEGTLVTVLEASLNLVHNPPYQTLVVLGYPDIYQAGDDVAAIVEFEPIGLEGIDHKLIERMATKGMHTRAWKQLPAGKGWLMVQFAGDSQEEADRRARDLIAKLNRYLTPPSIRFYDDKNDEKALWVLRETSVGATSFVPGQPPAWSGWEDAAVPPARVGDYLRDFSRLLERHELDCALYGHFGQGCIHCRITFDLVSKEGIRNYRLFAEQAAELVTSYGGSLSGEHGDGQSRGELLPVMFGNQIMNAFREFKSIWDPEGKMNPGKVIDANPLDSDLRLGADYRPWEPETHFKFPDDNGSFAHATLRCVGVGKCRRENSDAVDNQTMCPSYMATREEIHSTRGRAHLLWEMLQGSPITNRWRDDNVKEALDLCLSCKGCKGDCPVSVDIATYKSEFLSHYWEGRIRPRHSYAFGHIDKWSRVASLWPGLVNLLASAPGTRELIKATAGIAPDRAIPQFAPETFKTWFGKRPRKNHRRPQVLLFPDTFNNYFLPQTARAAVEVLEHAGYQVLVPSEHVCCGRPLYDHGFLDEAKRYLRRAMRVLVPYVERGIPIVLLEPSCWSVLRDEIHGLFPEREETRQIVENTFLFSEFLLDKADYYPPTLRMDAISHGHCHHKAIARDAEHERRLWERMQLNVHSLNDGCCGMAGGFGFEADKYDISVKIGEHGLLPAVRQARRNEVIIADGFSCREQISQLTNRRALHTAEVLQLALHHGPGEGNLPEGALVRERARGLRSSRLATLATLGTLTAAGVALARVLRNRE